MSMRKLLAGLDDWLAQIAISATVVITVIAVFMRYVLNNPLQWIEEGLIAIFIWAIMLGAASAMKVDEHVSIDAIVTLLPRKFQYGLRILNRVICMVLLGAFGYLGFGLAMDAGDKITPILGIKYIYLDMAVPIGAGWMIAHLIRNLIHDLKNPSGQVDTPRAS